MSTLQMAFLVWIVGLALIMWFTRKPAQEADSYTDVLKWMLGCWLWPALLVVLFYTMIDGFIHNEDEDEDEGWWETDKKASAHGYDEKVPYSPKF